MPWYAVVGLAMTVPFILIALAVLCQAFTNRSPRSNPTRGNQ